MLNNNHSLTILQLAIQMKYIFHDLVRLEHLLYNISLLTRINQSQFNNIYPWPEDSVAE